MPNPKSVNKATEKEKRVAARLEKMTEGMVFLETWLVEIAQQGMVLLKAQPPDYFAQRAARFTDMQLTAVAEQVRLLQQALTDVNEEVGWIRVQNQLETLWLLTHAWRRLPNLPTEAQADIRFAAGWPQRVQDLADDPQTMRLQDFWWVIGRFVEIAEPPLMLQREWLYGKTSGQFAQLLQYAYGNVPLQPLAPVGDTVAATLAFWKGTTPLRATVETRQETTTLPQSYMAGHQDWAAALADLRPRFAQAPWLAELPFLLETATLTATSDGQRWLLDAQKKAMPVCSDFSKRAWLHGLALSGSQPAHWFALWKANGCVWPLGKAEQAHYWPLIAASE